MSKGIFEKIVAGEIPSYKLFANDLVYAFLDVNPLSYGHALVIPKRKSEFLHQLSPEEGAAIGRALPLVAKALMKVTGVENYNVLQNNGRPAHQEVPHVHFHIIPKPSQDKGLKVGWVPLAGAAKEEIDSVKLAEQVCAEIEVLENEESKI